MTPYDRSRRREMACCRALALGAVGLLAAAVAWPVVALLAGYVGLAALALCALTAFR